jgi:uncharacterized protein (DUF433 family)
LRPITGRLASQFCYSGSMVAEWIVSDPNILGGKPCIKGTRISVQFVLELLASGASPEDVRDAYPHLAADGLAAAIQYAAMSLRNEVVWDVKLSV